MRNKNIEVAIKKVVAALREGNIKDIAYATFHSKKDKPSDNWSFLNYLTMILSGTEDARSYNAWKRCGRYVKKGTKAIYILRPITFKKTVTMVTEAGEEEVEKSVRWFKNVPVFAIEDTDGEPLPKTESFELKIPVNLLQVADELGLTVNAKGFYRNAYGYFSQQRKEIALMSPELTVYLHELSHAVDDKINGKLKGGQHSDQEVVAELSAEVVLYLMGYDLNGRSKKYIDHYSDKDWRLVFKLLNRVNKVVTYIAEHAEIKTDAKIEAVETLNIPALLSDNPQEQNLIADAYDSAAPVQKHLIEKWAREGYKLVDWGTGDSVRKEDLVRHGAEDRGYDPNDLHMIDMRRESNYVLLFGKKVKTEEQEVKARLDMLQAAEIAAGVEA